MGKRDAPRHSGFTVHFARAERLETALTTKGDYFIWWVGGKENRRLPGRFSEAQMKMAKAFFLNHRRKMKWSDWEMGK